MPVLEIGRALGPSWRMQALPRLRAVAAWPHDQERRQQFEATQIGKLLCGLQDQRESLRKGSSEHLHLHSHDACPLDTLDSAIERAERWLDDTGGWQSLVHAPSLEDLMAEEERRANDGMLAGMILAYFWQLAYHHGSDIRRGASINKAIHLILETSGGTSTIKDRREIKRKWSQYRCVAHIHAAIFDHFDWIVANSESKEEALRCVGEHVVWNSGLILDRAYAYQRFALNRSAGPRGSSLLDRESCWLLSDDEPWQWQYAAPDPLPPEMIALAKSYRAPQ